MSWHPFHRYKPVSVQHSTDVSFGEPGIPHTRILCRCACGKRKVRSITGHWALAELTEEASA